MKLDVIKEVEGQPIQFISIQRRSPRTILLIVSLVFVLLITVLGGYLILRPHVQALSLPPLPTHLSDADLGLSNWQDYQRALPPVSLDSLDLSQPPPIDSRQASLEDAAGQAFMNIGQVTHGLAYLRAAAQAEPDSLRYNDDYRLALRQQGRYAEEVTFFAQQGASVKTPDTAIILAMAYDDATLACAGSPDVLACQVQDATHAVDILGGVLSQHPYNIVARYERGLNYLYWPSPTGHLPQAQIDLQYVVALLQPSGLLDRAISPLAYATLGDVFAKDNHVDPAHTVWQNGKSAIANAPILTSRLSIPVGQLVSEENASGSRLTISSEDGLSIFWQNSK